MKTKSVFLPVLTATLFAFPALAADTPPAAPPPPAAPRGPVHEQILQRFDKDGDGQLNEAERAEARKAREEMKGKWADHGRKMREQMLQKFDANKDGKLDDQERQAARAEMQKKWGQFRGKHPGFQGPRGQGHPPEWMRRELHRWFEMKWSGDAGRHGRMHHRDGGPRDKMRHAITKRFDQDGDGKLNEAERTAARQAAKERHARMKENRQEVLARFDQDADGKLSDSERKGLRDAWQKFLQQQPVVAKKPAN